MGSVAGILLDKRSQVPIQHQLKRHIQFLIFSGELKEGERLPSQRELAGHVRVNRNTVSQVYAELEREGWVRGKTGSGTFVAAERHVAGQDRLPLIDIVDEALERAEGLGFGGEELLRTLQGRLRMRSAPDGHEAALGRKIAERSYL